MLLYTGTNKICACSSVDRVPGYEPVGRRFESCQARQKFLVALQRGIFYPLRSNGISSTHEVRRISSAPLGLYIIMRQRASQLRNDDIQFLAELVIYKDFVFDDIHCFAVIWMRGCGNLLLLSMIYAIINQRK